jgi:hypothetical protein
MMARKLIIVEGNDRSIQVQRFAALSRFFGIEPVHVSLKALGSIDFSQSCVAMDANTLGSGLQSGLVDAKMRRKLLDEASCVFVYLLSPNQESQAALRWITDDFDSSIRTVGSENAYCIDSRNVNVSAELSNLQWKSDSSKLDYNICLNKERTEYNPIITLGDGTFFSMKKISNCTVFLLANRCFLELKDTIGTNYRLNSVCSQFVPILMLLRYTFGDKCWHVDNRYANFIIDDPYLRPRYGFLRIDRLNEIVQRDNLAVTIAFIPWNYWRTHPDTARLVRSSNERIGLCIHGCNHGHNEFGVGDIRRLIKLTQDASRKMERHAIRSRIKHGNIMVFPQGLFSSTAMGVLKTHNYNAAVNTTPVSVDSPPVPLRYCHLLDTAILAYNDFPVFIRRYPSNDMFDYRMDAFLGRPLLFVEHHEFLKDDNRNLIEFAGQVNSFPFNIVWASLTEILDNAYKVRVISPTLKECFTYSNTVVLKNPYDQHICYRIRKKESNPSLLSGVFCHSKPVEYWWSDGMLISEITLSPYTQKKIVYKYKNPKTMHVKYSPQEFCTIAIRRILSDIRDNFLTAIRN